MRRILSTLKYVQATKANFCVKRDYREFNKNVD
jgi:hypothetical protein